MERLSEQKRVLLWTAPRCASSVFERSIRELKGVKVIYEPHQRAFLNGTSETKHISHTDLSYEHADSILLEDYRTFQAVFCKNMAFFIPSDRMELYLKGKFSNYQHTFLIRNPHLSIPSRWKICAEHGYKFSYVASIGYANLHKMFEHVRSLCSDVIVVDASDLLNNPEKMMQQYCMKTGLPYDKSMLTWTPGVVQDWTINKMHQIWHGNVINSSGFNVPKSQSSEISQSVHLPLEVQESIKESMPFYEDIYKYRIQI